MFESEFQIGNSGQGRPPPIVRRPVSVTQRIPLLFVFVALFVWALVAQRDPVEAVEIGRHNTHLLPKGKEADGIVGDLSFATIRSRH